MAKVLLVEDEISLREMYAEVLRDAGHEVEEIGDGGKALEHIQAADWDILLLDIMLPKLDGLQVLGKVKGDERLLWRPVVVISNLEDPKVIAECQKLGIKEFIVKASSSPADIAQAVEKYVSNEKS